MYNIDNSTAAATIPPPGAVGPNPNGFFTGGNPATSTPATIVDADWLNAVQGELSNAITGMGGTLSKTNRAQLLAILQSLAPYTGLISYGGSNNAAASGTSISTSVSFTPARACMIYINGQASWTNSSSAGAGFISLSGSGFTVQDQGGQSTNSASVSCLSSYSGVITAAAGVPVTLTLTASPSGNIGNMGINFTYIEVPTS